MLCFNHASVSIRATALWKMLMNNEFKADTSTGTPTGNSLCHTLASHALNMSRSFGQSACSIESRCVVMRSTQDDKRLTSWRVDKRISISVNFVSKCNNCNTRKCIMGYYIQIGWHFSRHKYVDDSLSGIDCLSSPTPHGAFEVKLAQYDKFHIYISIIHSYVSGTWNGFI